MFKVIFTIIGLFLLLILLLGMRTVGRILGFFFGKRTPSSFYNNTHKKEPQEPETQEERIISYQKKEFETTKAEDVDFVEIKDDK